MKKTVFKNAPSVVNTVHTKLGVEAKKLSSSTDVPAVPTFDGSLKHCHYDEVKLTLFVSSISFAYRNCRGFQFETGKSLKGFNFVDQVLREVISCFPILVIMLFIF